MVNEYHWKQLNKNLVQKNVENFKDKPKIYIIDACRRATGWMPYDDDLLHIDQSYLKQNDKQKCGNEEIIDKTKCKFYHPFVNIIEIFGNTCGYGVFDNIKGGKLLCSINKHFLQYSEEIADCPMQWENIFYQRFQTSSHNSINVIWFISV